MKRILVRIPLALTDSLATTPAIPFGDCAGGTIQIPAAFGSPGTLTFYTCDTESGTYLAAYNTSGAITISATTARSYPIPVDLFGAAWIKIVAGAAGSVVINLKS